MFRKPTVFVIGAGASKEYGLPLGDELKSGIAEDLSFYYGQGGVLETGNEAFRQLIQPLYVDNPKLLVPESRTLASILHARLSVDEALDFVGDNQRLVKVGKLGIAYQILQGERKSSLPSKPSVARAERTLQYLPDTWLTTFLSIALSGARQGDISSIFDNVTIIDFNNDRVIENYLFLALMKWSAVTEDIAAAATGRLKIIKPYGSLGPLPWQDQHNGVEYGDTSAAVRSAASIRTLTEQIDDKEKVALIRNTLLAAQVILFLGFGYHPANVELLKAQRPQRSSGVYSATNYRIDSNNDAALRAMVASSLNSREELVRLYDMKAGELMMKLRPSIVAAVS